jgi:hypothetical protein
MQCILSQNEPGVQSGFAWGAKLESRKIAFGYLDGRTRERAGASAPFHSRLQVQVRAITSSIRCGIRENPGRSRRRPGGNAEEEIDPLDSSERVRPTRSICDEGPPSAMKSVRPPVPRVIFAIAPLPFAAPTQKVSHERIDRGRREFSSFAERAISRDRCLLRGPIGCSSPMARHATVIFMSALTSTAMTSLV